MAEISLELLGRLLQTIQAELREMKFAADVERRNIQSRFDSLSGTLGSQLGDIEAKLTARVASLEMLLDDRFTHVDDRLSQIDDRFSKMDDRFSQIDNRFSQIDDRFSQIDNRFSLVENRLSNIDAQLDRIIDLLTKE